LSSNEANKHRNYLFKSIFIQGLIGLSRSTLAPARIALDGVEKTRRYMREFDISGNKSSMRCREYYSILAEIRYIRVRYMRVLLYVYILIYQVHSRNKTRVSGSSVPVLGVKLKRGLYLPWLFFKIDLRSATAFMGSSR